ncbi:MAG: hypothetical protein JNJ83_07080 [Verrucomicrobiaceae bacterium]|nr:hypothetical protein [Verrucomicrobiaceae bacterium]
MRIVILSKIADQQIVVEAEDVEDRGWEVVDGRGIAGDVPSKVVGLAIDLVVFDTAFSHPQADGTTMVCIQTGNCHTGDNGPARIAYLVSRHGLTFHVRSLLTVRST